MKSTENNKNVYKPFVYFRSLTTSGHERPVNVLPWDWPMVVSACGEWRYRTI